MHIKSKTKLGIAACSLSLATILVGAPAAGAETALFFDDTKTLFSKPNQPENFIAPSWYEAGNTSQVVDYPRQFAPFAGFKTLNRSTNEGADNAMLIIELLRTDGEPVSLVGIGQGAIVVLKTKKAAFEKYGDNAITEVVTYRDPTDGNGGILTKLPSGMLKLLGIPALNADDSQRARYETTLAIKYDLVADAPDVSFFRNPVAWLNAAMGRAYFANSYTLDTFNEAIENGDAVITSTYYNEAGEVIDIDTDFENMHGFKSHILIDKGVPLLEPLRRILLAINNDAGDVKVEAFIKKLGDKWIRPIVDKAYDQGDDPEVNTREVSTNTKPTPPVTQTDGTEDVSAQSSNGPSANRASVDSAQANTQQPDDQLPEPDAAPAADDQAASEPVASKKLALKERREARKAERKAAREAAAEERTQKLNDKVDETVGSVNESLSPSEKTADNTTNDASNDDKGGDGSESSARAA